MSVAEDLRKQLACERERSAARLRSRGVPQAEIDWLMEQAEEMHEEQVQCAARMVGEAPPVNVH